MSTWGGLVDGGRQARTEAPEAGVNIIAFDSNYELIDAAYDQVDDDAEQVGLSPDVPHDEMVKELIIKEAGYVYVYVSNNSPYNVYFDDVEITYTPTRVIQYNEYYPYGMQASTSWTRGNHKNDYLYNEGTEFNAMNGWYETMFRGYDPAIGRFLQIDPLAMYDASVSPYAYAGNNPVMNNDPLGLLTSAGSEYVPGMNYNTWRRTQYLRQDYASLLFSDWDTEFFNTGAGGGGQWVLYEYSYRYSDGVEATYKRRLQLEWKPDDRLHDPPNPLVALWRRMKYEFGIGQNSGDENNIGELIPGIVIYGKGTEQYGIRKMNNGRIGVVNLASPTNILSILDVRMNNGAVDVSGHMMFISEQDPTENYEWAWVHDSIIPYKDYEWTYSADNDAYWNGWKVMKGEEVTYHKRVWSAELGKYVMFDTKKKVVFCFTMKCK